MRQSHGIRTFQMLGVLYFSLLMGGCFGVIDFPFTVTEHPAGEKFNLKIELSLTQQLLDSKWEVTDGNMNIIYLGEPFSQNAEYLARLLFTEVFVSRPTTDSHSGDQADAILTPKLVSLNHSRPALAGFDEQTTAVFEWRLTDVDQNIIWVKSITSKTLSMAGGLGSIDFYDREHVTLLLNDLFKKSFDAMSSSPEIKEFSQSRQS